MTPTTFPSPLPTDIPTPTTDVLLAPADGSDPTDDPFTRACAVLARAGIGFTVVGETEVVDQAA